MSVKEVVVWFAREGRRDWWEECECECLWEYAWLPELLEV